MSSDAFGELVLLRLKRRLFRVERDFVYRDKEYGEIVVKSGFVTNFASIDGLRNIFLFVMYALLVGYGDASATVHDWLYSGYGIIRDDGTVYYPKRKECDRIFYNALREEGVARWRAWLFYYGVRAFGGNHFHDMHGVFPTSKA